VQILLARGRGSELARLTLFSGAEIVVLVECKHQRRAVERDEVHILESKLRDVSTTVL
jgi:hypothetical protein